MDIRANQFSDLELSVAYHDDEEQSIPIDTARLIVKKTAASDESILDLVADTDSGIVIQDGVIEITLDANQMDFWGDVRYEISGTAGSEDLIFVSGYLNVERSLQ